MVQCHGLLTTLCEPDYVYLLLTCGGGEINPLTPKYMSEELALGQRELSIEESVSLSPEEKELVVGQVVPLLVEILKVSGKQTLNSLLGELSQNASQGLSLSAKPSEGSEEEESAEEPHDGKIGGIGEQP